MLFTWSLALVAMGMFVPLFATGGVPGFDFWWWMSVNGAVLSVIVVLIDAEWRKSFQEDIRGKPGKKAALGLLAAVFLYGVFFVGNLASRYIFSFASSEIEAVYNLKNGVSLLRVGLLIGLVIGPAEEWFWRGFVQRRMSEHYGKWMGFVLATALYTGMHFSSANPMLVLAAAVCGAFWGFLYLFRGSLLLCTVSHVAWDLAVFVFFPLSR